ncbi:MAG: AAA family ATPase [Fusobacteriaceae bacterium]
MIITEIKIKDFRPFYGISRIKLSKDLDKNITLINAENGTGKTTLLEAIKWCLYGKINLPNKDDFVNKRTGAEMTSGNDVDVAVELSFDDNDEKYIVKRSINFLKTGESVFKKREDIFTVSKTDRNGERRELSNPKTEIETLIPQDINFFFDGERLTNLEDKTTFKSTIESILGVKAQINAIDHLKKVKKRIENSLIEAERRIGRDNSADLREKKINKEKEKNSLQIKLKEKQGELLRAKNYYQILDDKRINIKHIESYISELRIQKDKKGKNEEEKNKEEYELRKLYSDKSYLSLITDLVNSSNRILSEKREKREVPSKISEYLIDDILKTKICICGNNIIPDSLEEKKLLTLKKSSTTDKMSRAFDEALYFVKIVPTEKKQYQKELKQKKHNIEKIDSNLKEINERISDLESKIGNDKTEEVQQLNLRVRETHANIGSFEREIGILITQIDIKESEIIEFEKRLEKIEKNSLETAIYKNRISLCEELIDHFETILNHYKSFLKSKLSKKIKEIYDTTTRKGYRIELNDEFVISIKDDNNGGRDVAVSTGEKKIATLCFIGALADVSREIYNKKTEMQSGRIFPIILDSPFGDLDPEHKGKVARLLPELADQIVLLASTSQYSQEVKEGMYHRVGEVYQLYNRNPKQNPNVKFEFTEIYHWVGKERVQGGYAKV